jgi:fatty-acid desaturase
MTTAAAAVPMPAPVRPRFDWAHLAFLAPVHASLLLAPWTFSWPNLAVAVGLHALSGGLGICVGYHRLLTHKAFTARRPLTYLLATLGALTIQGGPAAWLANHRQHHQRSDGPGDPPDASRGFWWAHMGWIFVGVPEPDPAAWRRRYAPDMLLDPYFRVLDRWYWALQVPLGLVLLWAGGWGLVVWGVGVRLVASYHTTYLVNSAGHWFGYQSYRTGDRSRSNWWVALLAYGEGWHNTFQLLGLVGEVRVPSRARRRARARAAAAGPGAA